MSENVSITPTSSAVATGGAGLPVAPSLLPVAKVSIIIPTHNNAPVLLNCLSAIRETTQDIEPEVIVVANQCSDNTFQVAKLFNAKVVNCQNVSYSRSCNVGAKYAAGDLLLFLNDDTLPAVGWLKALIDWMKELAPYRVAAVGPTSNFVGGSQMVRSDVPLTPENRHQVPGLLQERPPKFSGFLSGFCFMVRRSAFEEVGGWDERLVWGHEDNALALRLTLAGYLLAIIPQAYVYHLGNVTMTKTGIKEKIMSGVGNKHEFHRLYRRTGDKNLVTIIRAKIDSAVQGEHFIKSVSNARSYSSRVLILDDRSGLNLPQVVTDYVDGNFTEAQRKACPVILKRQEQGRSEIEDRNDLLKWAVDEGADWILSLDADEVLDRKVDRAYMERLMNLPVPQILSHLFHWYTLWDRDDLFNAGPIWGIMQGVRMFRNIPGRNHVALSGTGITDNFHNGNVPYFPMENVGVTSVRVKHYGYKDRAERERKKRYYDERDPNPNPLLVGAPNYNHLTDESDLRLREYVESNGIGCSTIIRNEEKLLPIFAERTIPFFDEYVFADTGSNDRTKELCEFYGFKVYDYPGDFRDIKTANFAHGRNFALSKSTTDWVFHLDIDEEVVTDDWWRILRMCDVPNQIYVFQVLNVLKDGRQSISETMRLFRREYYGQPVYYEGAVHETLDACVARIRMRYPNIVVQSPVRITHHGYLKPGEEVKDKLGFYKQIAEREIMFNPDDGRHYFNIALYDLARDGDRQANLRAVRMLETCIEKMPGYHQAFKELGFFYLRRAFESLSRADQLVPTGHHLKPVLSQAVQAVRPFTEKPYSAEVE